MGVPFNVALDAWISFPIVGIVSSQAIGIIR